jgi:hypothetical protein
LPQLLQAADLVVVVQFFAAGDVGVVGADVGEHTVAVDVCATG